MRLGARPGAVIAMVLGESALPVIAGVAFGVLGALAAGQLIESMLFGLKPRDAVSLACAIAVLLASASALVAGWWPARRASRIAPMAALRHD